MCNTVNFSPKAMSSYHHLLQQTKPRFESPAKVFAKLKAKVQREAMCARDPYCNVREKHGADFNSPRKRTESTWMNEEPTENHRFGSYRSEVQALTLSPISTPQKTLGYSLDISSKPAEEMPPVSEMGHAFLSRYGHTPTTRAFLESTAVSHPLCQVNREEIRTKPPQIRDDGFKVTSRTPVQIQPVENDCVRAVFEEDYAPLGKPMSPAKMFSPMRKRLRKRKWEQQEFNKVSSSTKEVNSEVISQPKERKTSTAFSEDNGHNKTCIEDLGNIIGLPADQSEMNPLNHDPVFPPPRSATEKRCYVVMEKCPPMSPAKMFAFMKERESKRGQQEVHEVSSSTRELFGNNFRQSRDTPLSTPHGVAELEDIAFRSVSESVVPVDQSIVESADSQSDPSEDVAIPAARSQPVLLEDPLVLNSPRISIPKKHQAVFKHNKWPQLTKFPNESVIYLKQWFLRKNHKGLFVDGIHRENNIPWNSNIIADRVSNSVLKTVSGRVYILVGRMNLDVDSGFPKWLLKKFANGFPPNWKTLYEKFLSESRHSSSRKTEKTSEGRAIVAKTKSDPSSINLSVKPQRQKPFKTPDSCPPSISASTKVSRSGRVIKPPLEYWKGGRVILDAHMNVTIHECYDTSICIPEVTTMVSARKSQKPARVFLPCSEGHKQCESATNEEAPGPQRKVKAPLRKHSRAKGNHDEKPPNSPEPLFEAISSPEECSGRTTRSSKRSPAMEKISYVDTVSEKTSTWRSKKQAHDPTRPSERGRKQTVTASPESPTVNDKTLQQQSSDEEFSIKRKKQKTGLYRKKGRKVLNKSQSSHMSPSTQSSESFEESGKEPKERTRLTKKSDATQTLAKHKPSKGTKISPPTKTLPKSTQSHRAHKANKGSTTIPQEQDEDEWSEAELIKLKEAVSYYPKHVAGYWAKVARMVGTRSAEECHNQHTSHGVSQTPAKRAKKPRKEKVEAPKDPDRPVISARVGTLKRKQQVRQFLEAMPREDADDVFSSAYMQNKRFEIPSMCPSEDHDLTVSDLEPLTPMSKVFPEVKTPQCLHITPGMMGSPNRSNDDKYVYQLQKRMKKNQFNVCKQAHSAKSFTPTPSVKRTMRRCGNTENDTFVVWEMFPGNDVALSESGEEEDFYFSDND